MMKTLIPPPATSRYKYRLLQAALDERGLATNIVRVAPKWYEVHENFEIKKRYKTRRSANKHIERLYNKNA